MKRVQALYGYASRQVAPREQLYAAGPGEVTVVYEIQERPRATVVCQSESGSAFPLTETG